MLGAIAGDIIGSIYEVNPHKSTVFPLFGPGCEFTDDTVLTVAVAETLMHGIGYRENFQDFFRMYPYAGYGTHFIAWAHTQQAEPYNSWGNGSAMRVCPVSFAFETLDEVLSEAERSAAVTHNHPEGINGAQAAAAAGFLARKGSSKGEIRDFVRERFGYPLDRTLDDIRPGYRFDVSCQGSVPVAILAFLESDGYEDAVRKAVSMGGDSDTLACITGGIAHAAYGLPDEIAKQAVDHLDERLSFSALEFCREYRCL
jgi:ADP-ribosylglycohydrolase